MAEPISKTDSLAYSGVIFTQDQTTPLFTTVEPHGLSVNDSISITRSSSLVITGEGEFNHDFNEWLYGTGTEYIIDSIGGDGGDSSSKTFTLQGLFDTSQDTSSRTIEYHSTTVVPKEDVVVVVEEETADGFQALLTATAEWKPHQIAKAGDISTLAAAASTLAETVKSSLGLAEAGMEVTKILAKLQNINPLLIALDLLADEVLKQIQDLKEAGYYYLFVDPYFKKNVSPSQPYDYGFEQLRDQAGRRIFLTLNKDSGEFEEEVEGIQSGFPSLKQINSGDVKPAFASPRKLIPGGYNSRNPTVDPLTTVSKFPTFRVSETINEFIKAFDDEGDVPRYKSLGKVSAAPKIGEDVYDTDGNPYKGWDPNKDYGLALFNIGKAQQDGSIIKDYVSARKPINSKVSVGKPSILGNTEFDGGSGAIAIIVAAPDFKEFTDVYNKFSAMFSDIPEFSPTMGKNLLDSLNEIITPNDVIVNITMLDTNYGEFIAGDVIGSKKYDSYGKIRSIDPSKTVPTVMVGKKQVQVLDDLGNDLKDKNGNVLSQVITVDLNPDGRYQNMELVVSPIRGIDSLNPFIPGDRVNEQEVRGTGGFGEDIFPNYVMKGLGSGGAPMATRVYPKTALVAKETLMVLPDSILPDFGGIQIKDIVPGWGEFFQTLENFVKQLKGMISDSAAFIQDMIDMIKQIQAFLEYMIKIIDEFLKFFQITLPAAGVYALYIPNQNGGTEGIKAELKAAGGIPDLGYSMGILFVGTEADKLIAGGGSKNPIDLLALVLGLL
jgi:hypothetical protein